MSYERGTHKSPNYDQLQIINALIGPEPTDPGLHFKWMDRYKVLCPDVIKSGITNISLNEVENDKIAETATLAPEDKKRAAAAEDVSRWVASRWVIEQPLQRIPGQQVARLKVARALVDAKLETTVNQELEATAAGMAVIISLTGEVQVDEIAPPVLAAADLDETALHGLLEV